MIGSKATFCWIIRVKNLNKLTTKVHRASIKNLLAAILIPIIREINRTLITSLFRLCKIKILIQKTKKKITTCRIQFLKFIKIKIK